LKGLAAVKSVLVVVRLKRYVKQVGRIGTGGFGDHLSQYSFISLVNIK
jgi:hypothetical protein